MDWKRFAKKNLIPFYNTKDLVSKIKDNGFADGVKIKLKEDFIEDMPLVGNVYDYAKAEGRRMGKYEGYNQASYEYEKKLIKQAEEFLKQANVLRSDKARYEKLIDDYERYIDEMMQKDNLSNQEKDYMNQIMIMERKLIELNTEESSYSDNATSNLIELDERGFIKNTARHKNGTKYDDDGYDKFGYDKNGYNKDGLDKLGHPRKL